MTNKRTYNDIIWIDMLSPTPEEVRELIETYNLNPDVSNNMLLPSPNEQIYDYKGLVYLVLHFPHKIKNREEVIIHEVDFLMSKNVITTIHYDHSDAIDRFAKYFEVSSVLKKNEIPDAGYLFFELIKQLYGAVKDATETIDSELQSIEPKVFHGREKEVVSHLSVLNHSLLQFKQIVSPQKELLEMAAIYGENMFGKEFKDIGKMLLAEHAKALKEIEYRKENLKELWDTNDTLLSTKQNEIMKNLAMISFITFPLTLIVAIFELFTSLEGRTGGADYFWKLMSLLLIATGLMIFFFKRKRWI